MAANSGIRRSLKHAVLMAVGGWLIALPAVAETFNTTDVLRVASDGRSCLNYRITSQCVYAYISCNLFGCKIKTQLRDRIEHRLPDLVVTAFQQPGKTPFTEIRNTASVAALAVLNSPAMQAALGDSASGGSVQFNNGRGIKQGLTFNESNVVGTPVIEVIRNIYKYQVPSLSGSPYLCPSAVTPLKPYFMSELDALAWRSAALNTGMESLVPGRREIGTNLLKTWGSVYPRIGFVMQNQAPKAAAVIAQRAIDLVTQRHQRPHIYSPFVVEGVSEKSPVWQMISPTPASHCEAFGAEGEWAANKQTESGEFAWNYWKEYECCKPGRGWRIYP